MSDSELDKAVDELKAVIMVHVERIVGPFVRWLSKLLDGVK